MANATPGEYATETESSDGAAFAEMSAYNELRCFIQCPRCGCNGDQVVEIRFGILDQSIYSVGDRINWALRKSVANGGKPQGDDTEFEGYCECAYCCKDFWLMIRVLSDKIVDVEANHTKLGYIP